MVINIFKNPVVIGLIAGTLAYLYLWWTSEKITDERKKTEARKSVSIIIPIIVAVVAWFAAYMYFGNTDTSSNTLDNTVSGTTPIAGINLSRSNGAFTVPDNVANLSINENIDIVYSSSDPAKSFHLIGKGINIPHKLPDVFIETI